VGFFERKYFNQLIPKKNNAAKKNYIWGKNDSILQLYKEKTEKIALDAEKEFSS